MTIPEFLSELAALGMDWKNPVGTACIRTTYNRCPLVVVGESHGHGPFQNGEYQQIGKLLGLSKDSTLALVYAADRNDRDSTLR